MKFQTPLDSVIQNCLVIPWYESYGKFGDVPYFGHVTTSPNTEGIKDPVQFGQEPRPKTYPSSDMFLQSNFDKQLWFKESDGSYKFVLEVPGYGREHISVEIEDDGFKFLKIFCSKIVNDSSNHCFTEQYNIPDAKLLDLEKASAKVEHGVLTIFFPVLPAPKAQTIKLL